MINVNAIHEKIRKLFQQVLEVRVDCGQEVVALMMYERGRTTEAMLILSHIDPDIPLANSAFHELSYQMLLLSIAEMRMGDMPEGPLH